MKKSKSRIRGIALLFSVMLAAVIACGVNGTVAEACSHSSCGCANGTNGGNTGYEGNPYFNASSSCSGTSCWVAIWTGDYDEGDASTWTQTEGMAKKCSGHSFVGESYSDKKKRPSALFTHEDPTCTQAGYKKQERYCTLCDKTFTTMYKVHDA